MPELPEVHTIVSDLNKVLPGLKIQDVWCDLPRLWGVKAGCVKNIIKNPKTLASFKKQIVSKKILSVKRVGKNILISLDKNKTILIHQKMTGHMLYGKWEKTGEGKYPWVATQKGVLKDDLQNRFLHLIFYLSNGKQLSLSDIRKFAKVLICETDKLGELKDIKDKNDIAEIKSKTEVLSSEIQKIGAEMYKDAGPATEAPKTDEAPKDDTVKDAEYKEVDDNKNEDSSEDEASKDKKDE